ncbi:MAG TPA: hypothetical protein VMI53_14245, partial [Opitutaceae bacterium]|nr:hypothetical protein [Opitutaceae bacterium]
MKTKYLFVIVIGLAGFMQPRIFCADSPPDEMRNKLEQTIQERDQAIRQLEQENQELKKTAEDQARRIEALELENRELRGKLEQIGNLSG